MKISKKDINKYYDSRTCCEVLAGITNDLKLIQKYGLIIDDFITPTHRALFLGCYNLRNEGFSNIKLNDLEIYFKNNDDRAYKLFFDDKNIENKEWLVYILDKGLNYPENSFEFYCSYVRKLSQLRAYMRQGIDVSSLLDLNELDNKIIELQKERLYDMTPEDINDYFLGKIMSAKNDYTGINRDNVINAGENIREVYESYKEAPDYGFNDILPEMTTIFRGQRRGTFNLYSMDSGLGKSRMAIYKLMTLSARQYWSFEKNDFIDNPNGVNAVLYIGTELTFKEIQTPLIAFVSGVEEHKMREGNTTREEEERIEKALDIIEDMQYFLCDEEDYSMQYIHDLIAEYKEKYNISAVILDYLEMTNQMMIEFSQMARGMKIRDDLIMLNASKQLKNMAREFDIYLAGYTQVTEEGRRDYKVRNQSVIPNGKATVNKADSGIVGMMPVEAEKKILESILKNNRSLSKHQTSNLVLNVYKNRGGVLKLVKLFCHINLGNYHIELVQATDWFFSPIKIDKTYVTFKDNELKVEID